jgi:hypothetical protein
MSLANLIRHEDPRLAIRSRSRQPERAYVSRWNGVRSSPDWVRLGKNLRLVAPSDSRKFREAREPDKKTAEEPESLSEPFAQTDDQAGKEAPRSAFGRSAAPDARRRMRKPMRPKPLAISTQVAGSGTAVGMDTPPPAASLIR